MPSVVEARGDTSFSKIINFAQKFVIMEINFLRTLLIIFIIYYIGRLFTRYIMPALFMNYMEDKVSELAKKQQKMKQQEYEKARKREGQVTIENASRGNGKGSAKGEYVDYEEVK
jgi:hypothetical protein